jgi:hypothetical protein
MIKSARARHRSVYCLPMSGREGFFSKGCPLLDGQLSLSKVFSDRPDGKYFHIREYSDIFSSHEKCKNHL